MKRGFEPGHPKHGGRKKGVKNRSTVWVLDALKQRGYNYEKELVEALREMRSSDPAVALRAFDMVDRLIKLAPHIANKPKEHVGLEGVDELVINPYQDKKPEEK